MAAAIDLAFWREAAQLRATWQGRILVATSTDPARVPSNELHAVILSILAHCYDDTDAMPVLLQACFPLFTSVKPPFICSIAHVDKAGRIVADTLDRDGRHVNKNTALFHCAADLQSDMRTIADAVKLADFERREFFACIHKWCPADHRLDPAMSPFDPAAKRLTVH